MKLYYSEIEEDEEREFTKNSSLFQILHAEADLEG